ncbi:MAG TPA: cytochrome b, partial [Devosia sp.]|nr:cytochrome b [Devosia sp.]
NFLMLVYLGAQPAVGVALVLSKVGTAYYFAYFLIILPIISRIEKPDPLPESISASVLAKSGE